MTRIAYIVSAYRLPEQLGRLLRRLDAGQATFYVHVDRRAPDAVADEAVRATEGLPVRFLSRHRSPWGSFGHVEATLKGIRAIVESGDPADYVVLLTGQDYPLRPPDEIAAFLAAAEGRSFMSSWLLPHPPWGPQGGLDRLERFHLFPGPRRLRLSVPRRARLPADLAPYGGSPYWCFARPLVEYVHRFTIERPEVVRFFRHVFVPDELFFQTILMNSPLRETIADDNLRYVDWSREPAPAVLRMADLPALRASSALFARKFDETVDAAVLNALDDR